MRRLLWVTAAALVLAPGAAAKFPQGNVLRNGGAEAGRASPNGETAVTVPGWKLTGTFVVNAYGGSNAAPNFWVFPPLFEAQRIKGGARFFAGGTADLSTATQTVDLRGYNAAIDAGVVSVKLSAWFGGYLSESDPGTVDTRFFGPVAEISRVGIGPVTPAERGNDLRFVQKSTRAVVPKGTRRLDVVMTAFRREGGYGDAYFDNVALELLVKRPKPPVLRIATGCAGNRSVLTVSSRTRLVAVTFKFAGHSSADYTKPFSVSFALRRTASVRVVAQAIVTGVPVATARAVRLQPCG